MARERRKFTQEFKSEVIGLIKQSDKTVAQVARDLDLTESSVHTWVKQYDIDAGKGPIGALTTAERGELTQLRRRVRELQMERDILKKATAFFARESK
jgi:transposase-like protein